MEQESQDIIKRFFILIIFCGVTISCNSSHKSKPENKPVAVQPSEKNNSVPDTSRFNTLSEIIGSFSKDFKEADKRATELRKRIRKGDNVLADSLRILDSLFDNVANKRNNEMLKFIRTHEKNTENFLAMEYLVVDWNFSGKTLDSLFKQFPSLVRESQAGKRIAEKIYKKTANELSTVLYKQVLDLSFYTQDNKEIKLSSINAKYLVLDFWAAWCTPCRYENRWLAERPELLKKNKNVCIVAVSLDTDRQQWIKASQADKLPYLNISDLKGFESEIAKKMKIERIPFNMVISKEGKILATNLWKENLLNFIGSLQ